jgi:hypothetical protein
MKDKGGGSSISKPNSPPRPVGWFLDGDVAVGGGRWVMAVGVARAMMAALRAKSSIFVALFVSPHPNKPTGVPLGRSLAGVVW